jgi:hypothetical protein
LQDFVFGKTPLHIAIECKNVQIVQLLIKYNARIDIQDFYGRTPLDISEDLKPFLIGESDNLSKKTPSFDCSELSNKEDSIIEPESENPNIQITETFQSSSNFSFGSDPHKNSMYKWLTSMKLEFLFPPLYTNGYDDLDFLLAQIRSSEALTVQVLEEIGIQKLGHRLKLLALLEDEAFKDMRNSMPVKQGFLCVTKEKNMTSLGTWLDSIGLSQFEVNFVENGIDDTESLMVIMNSKYPLDDEMLKRLGIEKSGHRQKILFKIREQMGHVRHKRVISRISLERDEPVMACEYCEVI